MTWFRLRLTGGRQSELAMEVASSEIKKQIYLVRGRQVMLDSALAELFETKTKVLNQAVRRNPERFPEDFMFQLNDEELRHKFDMLQQKLSQAEPVQTISFCPLGISRARA